MLQGQVGEGCCGPRLSQQGAGPAPPAGRLEASVKPGSGQAALSPRGGPGSLAELAGKAGLTMLNFLPYTCQLEPH